MLKPGITTCRALSGSRSWFGARRFASLSLLAELADRTPARRAEYHDAVIQMIQMPGGIWRDTSHHRLVEVDRLLFEALREHCQVDEPIHVSDVAASSGATSVDLFRLLSERFTRLRFTASDLARDAYCITQSNPRRSHVVQFDGQPLQYVVGPFALPAQTVEPWVYPLNHVVKKAMERGLNAAVAALRAADPMGLRDFETSSVGEYEVTKIPLLSYDCLQLSQAEANFSFTTADLLESVPSADVTRAMNILTTRHLDRSRVQRGLRNLLDALAPKGLLVLGRSPDADPGAARVTIYAKEQAKLRIVARLNGGYEEEALLGALCPVH